MRLSPCLSLLAWTSTPSPRRVHLRTASTAAHVTMAADFASMRSAELRQLLVAKGISVAGCFDKQALVESAERRRAQLEEPPAWPGGDPIEQGPSGAVVASLILLHGFGDSGGGFISRLGGPLIAMDGLRVVIPSAPRISLGGFPVSSWLGVGDANPGLGPSGPLGMLRAEASAVQPAIEYVHALIRREVARGVPAERVLVGGFSQGGLIAVRAALSFPDAPLGGALALSTFFGADDARLAPANERLRLLVAHGDADSIVPSQEGRRIADCVARLAPLASVSWKLYVGMQHATSDAEVLDVRAFVQSVMAGAGRARAAAAEAAELAPALAKLSSGELAAMSAAELRAHLRTRGVAMADCFERADLLARALEAR